MSSSLSSNDSSLSSNDSSSGNDDHITRNKVLMFVLANVTNYFMNYVVKNPYKDSSMTDHRWVFEILNGHPIRSYQMFRMKKLVFLELCDILETKYNLKQTRNVIIYEQVGSFLYMLSQPFVIVRKDFNIQDIIKPVDPSFRDTPDEILKDVRYRPYFRDCIGVIDGTHIRVCVSSLLQGVYIGQKGYTTTNVMVARRVLRALFACELPWSRTQGREPITLPLRHWWSSKYPNLRSHYLSNKLLFDLLPAMTRLRVLSMSHYNNITEVPDSLGKLTHLKYLDLSNTKIERLPDATWKLYNLQTLLLSKCWLLVELPEKIGNLVNLCHLDISGTKLKDMPV
ncbi:hypothetical protein JHK82_031472 [Glycine max]|nr:hypothetical protein JHK85_032128 [Glycine max]KAG5124735.1 hypothetical protein JHK82_031472 [Glycine max]